MDVVRVFATTQPPCRKLLLHSAVQSGSRPASAVGGEPGYLLCNGSSLTVLELCSSWFCHAKGVCLHTRTEGKDALGSFSGRLLTWLQEAVAPLTAVPAEPWLQLADFRALLTYFPSLPLAPFDVQDARSSASCRTVPATAVCPGRVNCPRRLQLFQPRLLEQVAALFLELLVAQECTSFASPQWFHYPSG